MGSEDQDRLDVNALTSSFQSTSESVFEDECKKLEEKIHRFAASTAGLDDAAVSTRSTSLPLHNTDFDSTQGLHSRLSSMERRLDRLERATKKSLQHTDALARQVDELSSSFHSPNSRVRPRPAAVSTAPPRVRAEEYVLSKRAERRSRERIDEAVLLGGGRDSAWGLGVDGFGEGGSHGFSSFGVARETAASRSRRESAPRRSPQKPPFLASNPGARSFNAAASESSSSASVNGGGSVRRASTHGRRSGGKTSRDFAALLNEASRATQLGDPVEAENILRRIVRDLDYGFS